MADPPPLHGAAAVAEKLAVFITGVFVQNGLRQVSPHFYKIGSEKVPTSVKDQDLSEEEILFPLGKLSPRAASHWLAKRDVKTAEDGGAKINFVIGFGFCNY